MDYIESRKTRLAIGCCVRKQDRITEESLINIFIFLYILSVQISLPSLPSITFSIYPRLSILYIAVIISHSRASTVIHHVSVPVYIVLNTMQWQCTFVYMCSNQVTLAY